MVEEDLIKRNYAQMANEQLISLANTEATLISYEAFLILKREFRKRNLPADIINLAEERRKEWNREKTAGLLEKTSLDNFRKIWNEMFQLKYEGASGDEIRAYLLDSGVPYDRAILYVREMKPIGESVIATINKQISRCACFLLLGLAILAWNYFSFFSIIAVGAGLLTCIRAAIAWAELDSQKTKIKTALKNLDTSDQAT